MTATNPHPFANPLNQSRFNNYMHGFSSHQQNHMHVNTNDLTIPDAKPYDPNAYRNLTVPNSDIPYWNGPVPASGFLGQSTMFKLSDGSVLDIKAHKIVYDPNRDWKDTEYWNAPDASINKPEYHNEWGPTETIESMLKRTERGDGTYDDPNLSPESIMYWKKANEESKKLEQNLTDEQKSLLDALHSGQLFPLSKLVDEK